MKHNMADDNSFATNCFQGVLISASFCCCTPKYAKCFVIKSVKGRKLSTLHLFFKT